MQRGNETQTQLSYSQPGLHRALETSFNTYPFGFYKKKLKT